MPTANDANKKTDIVFPELSYAVMGATFEVAHELPTGLPEKDYQKALAVALTTRKIQFTRERYIPLKMREAVTSKYFADFIIEDKILLELKVSPRLGYVHARQVITYLKSLNLRLGILIYFTKDGVVYRRIINKTSTQN